MKFEIKGISATINAEVKIQVGIGMEAMNMELTEQEVKEICQTQKRGGCRHEKNNGKTTAGDIGNLIKEEVEKQITSQIRNQLGTVDPSCPGDKATIDKLVEEDDDQVVVEKHRKVEAEEMSEICRHGLEMDLEGTLIPCHEMARRLGKKIVLVDIDE